MRRLLELITVFILGSALTFYIVSTPKNASSPAKVTDNPPPDQQSTSAPPPQAFAAPATKTRGIHSDQLAEAKRYLAQNQMDLFMQLLDQHRSDTDGRIFQQYRSAFLQTLQQLKTSKQYASAVERLRIYLRSEYDDVEALQALALFHYLQKNYLAAIDTLYQAKSYAHDTDKIAQIAARQRAIIAEYATELKSRNDNLALLDLYQRLVSVEPEYSANYIGLAQAYLALGNDADAQRTLNIIAYDPQTSAKVQQLMNVIENRAGDTHGDAEPIRLSRHGNNLLTRVLFNNRTNSRLLLDTGASLTVISPALLQEIGLDYNQPLRKAWFNTANGVVEAPIFVIDRVNIGSQTVDNLEVAVMDLNGNQDINGLLGMNFLQHFRFSIDHQHNVLYLSPRD